MTGADRTPKTDLEARAGLSPLIACLALGTVGLHLYANTLGTLPDLWMAALHFGLFGALCALTRPVLVTASPLGTRLALGLDSGLALMALAFAAYVIFTEDALFARQGTFTTADWVMGLAGILLALEFSRRATGWIIPLLSLLALTYVVWWGRHLDGVFQFPGLSPETVLFRASFSTEGLLGSVARLSWSVVFMFILFGAFLMRSGAGAFIIDLARLAAGRVTGGPGMVAVVASGMMGSVTGSAVANTVSTGVVTIPLMVRAGFPPRQAAGIEAAASTGGQLMPPVMGAGAFVMATLTSTSYLDIITVAAVPALLYFFSVAVFVRISARRLGLTPTLAAEEPDLKLGEVLARGWPFVLPIGVLVGLLIAGYTPTYAAGFAILAVIAASYLSPTPMGPRAIIEASLDAARTMTTTAMLLIAVGLIIMVINTTGLGNTISLMITTWAGGDLLLTLVLVALASLILGMGLPVTASYIVLATLSAPALQSLMLDGELIQQIAAGTLAEGPRAILILSNPQAANLIGQPMGVAEARALLEAVPPDLAVQLRDQSLDPARIATTLLAAHMIVFWLSQDSNVTPPVCLTAFAAAGIAGTPPLATGLAAWRIAKGLYVLPVLFAFTPLIGGDWSQIALIAVSAALGLYALAAALEGHMEGPLSPAGRAMAALAGLAVLWPTDLWIVKLGSMGMILVLLTLSRIRPRSLPAPATGS